MVRYYIHKDFIGKQHNDLSGGYHLTDKLSKRVLKQLLEKGNKFILSEEYEKPKAKRSSKKDDKGE